MPFASNGYNHEWLYLLKPITTQRIVKTVLPELMIASASNSFALLLYNTSRARSDLKRKLFYYKTIANNTSNRIRDMIISHHLPKQPSTKLFDLIQIDSMSATKRNQEAKPEARPLIYNKPKTMLANSPPPWEL